MGFNGVGDNLLNNAVFPQRASRFQPGLESLDIEI
jgi:hypothetical protein